jgi:Icc-related predicted phosphoesterase
MANIDENAKAKKKTRPKKRIKIEKNSLSGGVLTTWNDSEGHPIKSIFSKTLEKGTDLLVGNKQVVGIWMAVALFFSIASGGIIPLVAIGIGLAVVGGARSYTSGKYDKIQKTKEAYEEYLGEDEGELVELDEKLGLDFEEVENIQYQIEDIHKEMEILTEQNAGVECKDWLPEQRDKYYKLEQQSIKLKRSFTNLKRSVSNSKIEAAKLKENLEMLYSILKIKEEDQLDLDNLCVQNFDEFFGELDLDYSNTQEQSQEQSPVVDKGHDVSDDSSVAETVSLEDDELSVNSIQEQDDDELSVNSSQEQGDDKASVNSVQGEWDNSDMSSISSDGVSWIGDDDDLSVKALKNGMNNSEFTKLNEPKEPSDEVIDKANEKSLKVIDEARNFILKSSKAPENNREEALDDLNVIADAIKSGKYDVKNDGLEAGFSTPQNSYLWFENDVFKALERNNVYEQNSQQTTTEEKTTTRRNSIS